MHPLSADAPVGTHVGTHVGQTAGEPLTARERTVLRLVVERYSNQDIADRLVISKRTVESHVATLLRKFGTHDRRTLIAAAGPTSFRAALSDTLRTTTDPVEVHVRAAELLGRHLAADRAYYEEFHREDGTFTVHAVHSETLPSIAGTYVLADFTDDPVEQALRTGRPLVVRDSADLDAATAAAWHSLSVRAAIAAPAMRNGVCVAALAVASARPRDWTDEDVALLVETAERTWSHVERVRLEAELHETEQRFRLLADAVDAIVWQTDADGKAAFLCRAFLAFTGLSPDAVGTVVWQDVVRLEDDRDGAQDVVAALRRRADWRGPVALRRHDGVWHTFDGRVTPRLDSGGSHLGRLYVCHR